MKTLSELKKIIDYQQVDSVFLDYLKELEKHEVIIISAGDITGENVSDSFYKLIAGIYGIQLDDELNPVNMDEVK